MYETTGGADAQANFKNDLKGWSNDYKKRQAQLRAQGKTDDLRDDVGEALNTLHSDIASGAAKVSEVRQSPSGYEGRVTYRDGTSFTFRAGKEGIIPSSIKGNGASNFYKAAMNNAAETTSYMKGMDVGTQMLSFTSDPNSADKNVGTYALHTNVADSNGQIHQVSQPISRVEYNQDGTAVAYGKDANTGAEYQAATFTMGEDGSFEMAPTISAESLNGIAQSLPDSGEYTVMGNSETGLRISQGDKFEDVAQGAVLRNNEELIATTASNTPGINVNEQNAPTYQSFDAMDLSPDGHNYVKNETRATYGNTSVQTLDMRNFTSNRHIAAQEIVTTNKNNIVGSPAPRRNDTYVDKPRLSDKMRVEDEQQYADSQRNNSSNNSSNNFFK